MSSTRVLAPGTLIAGRYRIEDSLGGEGSAAVYRAADTRLERAVALRAIGADAASGAGAQHGRAAARLVHANVARVLDFGEDAEAGLQFVVADLGSGGTLAALLAQRGTPPLALAMRMLQETAAGMAAAHHAGLVHGDLHPGVLWLSRDEGRLRVQVLGLGLDPSGAVPPRVTAPYASPERLRKAAALTPAADVFSLGAIGFEVLAGLPDDWTSLLLAMARGKGVVAPSPAESRPEIPPHVAQAVRRALVADPAGRWTDAGAVAAQLFAERAAAPAPPKPPALAATDLADTLYIPPAAVPAPTAATEPPPAKPTPVKPPPAPLPTPSVALVPVPDEVPARVAVAAAAPAAPVAERRREGMERLGRGGASSRVLLAAGVVLALVVGGGVVAKTVLAGPDADAATLAGSALAPPVAARTVAAEAPAGPAAEPEPAAALPPAATPEEERQREEQRLRSEEQRRLQQQRLDSIRITQQALARVAAAAPQQAAAPGSEPAPAAPKVVEERQAAGRIEPAVTPPVSAAPARAAVDPARVYGGDEVDQRPALSNTSAFRSAVQRTYPGVLRNSGAEGRAIVTFVVLEDGRVDRGSVDVSEVSHPPFRGAAVAAIMQARFTPARIAGQAVKAQVSIPITWRPANE